MPCVSCGSPNLKVEVKKGKFPYGMGEDAVVLSYTAPVSSCPDCNLEYTGHEGEQAREEAVLRHLAAKAEEQKRELERLGDPASRAEHLRDREV
jgi:hypothetical protein